MAAAAEKETIRFVANPVQHRFIRARNKADLFAARMGEGKSAALCWSCFDHVRENPGATHAFIRDSWENLRDTTFKEFMYWFASLGEWYSSTKTWKWNQDIGLRGEVHWLGMMDPKDGAKLQSRSLAGVFVDEPAPAAESGGIDESIFDMAITRLRQPGMKNYVAKLATNNPDESHWTYRKFVDPGTEGFQSWQTTAPENLRNLPPGYYDDIRKALAHRPDLVRRFVDGKYGFQTIGKPVTPEWADDLHLANELDPSSERPLYMLWDFGLSPVCLISQVDPMGFWNFLASYAVDDMGTYELIQSIVKPELAARFHGGELIHIGDPAGEKRFEGDARQSPVRVIKREIGGRWRSGPVRLDDRVDPLRWALTQNRMGRGMVQVDRRFAKHVWFALRGGWHFHVARTGNSAPQPVKNHPHSDVGDACGYGAAVLYPHGRVRGVGSKKLLSIQQPHHFAGRGLGFEKPGLHLPKHGERLLPKGDRGRLEDELRRQEEGR